VGQRRVAELEASRAGRGEAPRGEGAVIVARAGPSMSGSITGCVSASSTIPAGIRKLPCVCALSRPGARDSLTDVLRVCVVADTLSAGRQSMHRGSSVGPLQSSSMPVPQSSGDGSTLGTHARAVAWQGTVPAAQAPGCRRTRRAGRSRNCRPRFPRPRARRSRCGVRRKAPARPRKTAALWSLQSAGGAQPLPSESPGTG
jgi:hypothetical protein